MMTFLQVFRPVCLEAEAAPAAKELIPHFLILGSTSTLSLQMKPLLGSRSHLRLQKSSRWNMSLLQDSWGPPVAEGHREPCLLPEPFTGTFCYSEFLSRVRTSLGSWLLENTQGPVFVLWEASSDRLFCVRTFL